MKTTFLLSFLLITLSLHAQTGLQRTYSTGIPGFSAGLIPYNNGYVISGASNFSYDSSWLHLIFLDGAGDVSSEKAWRASLPLTFMNHADKLTSGFLFCGIGSPNLGDFHPYLAKTDNSGAVQWSKWFDNLGFSSHQLNAMVTNGNAFTVYSYPDGPTEGFYRIEGDETGSTFSAVSVTYATPSASMRIYEAVPFSTPSDHLLAGTGSIFPTVNGPDGLLIKMNPTTASWSQLFDFGSHIFFDGFSDAMISSGDNPLAVAYSENDTTFAVTSFVMKLNSSGTITWCKKLELGSILEMFSIAETSSGEVMVCGINESYDGILIKLSATGDLIWARKWTPSIAPLSYFEDLYRDSATNEMVVSGTQDGSFLVLHLDENGNGCGFEELAGLQVSDFIPVITNLPLTISSFSVTTQTETLTDRVSTITTQDICETGIQSPVQEDHPDIFPNPAHDVIIVSLPASLLDATVNLFDATGRKVFTTVSTNSITKIAVNKFQPGIYLLEVISRTEACTDKVIIE